MAKRKKNNKKIIELKVVLKFVSYCLIVFCLFRYYPTVKEKFIKKSIENSFVLENIFIEGTDNINNADLYEILPVSIGDSLISINVEEIKDVLKVNSWISEIVVFEEYPNSLYINIIEKIPEAITINNGKFVIVDKEGDVLTQKMLSKYEKLPMVIADKEKISEIIDYVYTQPYLYDIWNKAEYIGNRRWNIILNDDIKVMLPEKNVVDALEKLNELRLKKDLLKYKVQTIDLRFSDKVIIK